MLVIFINEMLGDRTALTIIKLEWFGTKLNVKHFQFLLLLKKQLRRLHNCPLFLHLHATSVYHS